MLYKVYDKNMTLLGYYSGTDYVELVEGCEITVIGQQYELEYGMVTIVCID